MEPMRLAVEGIWPGLPNSQCVVGESVTKNPQRLVAIQLFRGEPLLEGLERRNESRVLTFRKQRFRDLFTALGVTH